MANNFEENYVVCKKDYDEKFIKRSAAAFANSTGGKIYIGIDDFGQVIGLDDPEDVLSRVKRLLQKEISPDISPFVEYSVEQAEGRRLLGIEVSPGSGAPYWLNELGLTREGTPLRKNGATVCADDAEIRNAIAKAAEFDRYESRRAIKQDLTFLQAAELFDRQDVKLDREQLRTLGLTDRSGAYSNLAYLISDQCHATIRVVAFDDEARPREKVDLLGSIFRQTADALKVVDRNNKRFAKTRGGKSVDDKEYREYPEIAAREAILNAALHRDYEIDAPTLVKIFRDRIEILSPGGLTGGLEPSELELGAALSRNKNLVELFALLHESSAGGSGILRMRRAYADCAIPPAIDVSKNYFRVALPNAFARRIPSNDQTETVGAQENNDVKIAKYAKVGFSV